MRNEIQKVLETDDAGLERVKSASLEAQEILEEARRRSDAIAAEGERTLLSALEDERAKIMEDAERRARHVSEETNRYMEKLRQRHHAVLDDLMNRLLRKVTSL